MEWMFHQICSRKYGELKNTIVPLHSEPEVRSRRSFVLSPTSMITLSACQSIPPFVIHLTNFVMKVARFFSRREGRSEGFIVNHMISQYTTFFNLWTGQNSNH